MIQRKWLYAIVLVLIVFLLASCGPNFAKNSFRTLSVSKATYEVILSSAGDMYKEGLLTEDQKNEFISVGHKYRDAQKVASDAAAAYMITESAENERQVEVALTAFNEIMAELFALARKYGIKYEGGT